MELNDKSALNNLSKNNKFNTNISTDVVQCKKRVPEHLIFQLCICTLVRTALVTTLVTTELVNDDNKSLK